MQTLLLYGGILNVITYVMALNPKPTRCTCSCSLCTSDKVILLQSTKGATIYLNGLNFIDVDTAFLANLHRRFFTCCVLCCYSFQI